MSTGELSCEECESLLPLVADGALDADSDPALFAHLARCMTCQDSLACHDLVALSLTRTPMPAPRRLTRLRLPVPWAVGSAAALLVAGVGGFQYLHAVSFEQRVAHGLQAMHRQPAVAADEPSVITIGGIDPQHPSYILAPDHQRSGVAGQLPDPIGADTSLLHSVGDRY